MSAQRHRRRQGFTLLELMVALVIGGLVVAAVFTLGGASSRHFQEQQRIGVTQRSVRMAMERLRRDIARSGYLSVPDTTSPTVRMCPQPASLPVQAIQHFDADGDGVLVNRAANGVSADRLVLTGNYATSDGYLVRAFDGAGTQVILQSDWLAFQRAFFVDGMANAERFQDVFRPGRFLHIETPSGYHSFVAITDARLDASGATISISPALGANNPCLRGLGRGSIVSPISMIQYSIGAATPTLASKNPTVTGPNTVLYRDELDMRTTTVSTVTVMQRQPVLEYAIDFNLDYIVDLNINPTQPPQLAARAGGATFSPWQVRSVIASIAARTPEQDRRFPWVPPIAGAPLNRFQVFTDREGAARVRQLRTEIQMPNLVSR